MRKLTAKCKMVVNFTKRIDCNDLGLHGRIIWSNQLLTVNVHKIFDLTARQLLVGYAGGIYKIHIYLGEKLLTTDTEENQRNSRYPHRFPIVGCGQKWATQLLLKEARTSNCPRHSGERQKKLSHHFRYRRWKDPCLRPTRCCHTGMCCPCSLLYCGRQKSYVFKKSG